MPQKRNPTICEGAVAVSRLLRSLGALGPELMVVEHERDMSTWIAEWAMLPSISGLAAKSLASLIHVTEGLVVNETRMRQNLDAAGDHLMSESLMMDLAVTGGRQWAHEVVLSLCRDLRGEGSLLSAALEDEEILAHLSPERVRAALSPERYAEPATRAVEAVLRKATSTAS